MRALLAALLLVATQAIAEPSSWLTVPFKSYHFKRDSNYNEANWGLGVEIGMTDRVRAIGGVYRNSLDRDTVYAGVLWLPYSYGRAHAGVLGMCATGYSRFACVPVPAVAFEGRTMGLNVVVVPPLKETGGGALGFQFKLRFQ